MGGRGANGIADAKQLKKNLTTARRKETRFKNRYKTKAGAVKMFDWKAQGGKRNKQAKEKYNAWVKQRDDAEKKYLDAKKKREQLEKRVKRLTKSKRPKNAPLF